MMLKHLGMQDVGRRIENATLKVIEEGKFRTGDLGGKATTTDFTKAICEKIAELEAKGE
jgi:isocitrate dehydrogenase (NAD+)